MQGREFHTNWEDEKVVLQLSQMEEPIYTGREFLTLFKMEQIYQYDLE
jgi:hypothetical protein